jgi:hypothetical protein
MSVLRIERGCGQGRPKNEEIDEVVSLMTGDFKLTDEGVTFRNLSFGVLAAAITLRVIMTSLQIHSIFMAR